MGEEKIKSFEDLIVYQKAYQLVLKVHKLTQTFPEAEKREIGYQLRRAAISIPANIAEGYGRKNSAKEFKHFLRNALGSSNEMIVLLKLSRDLGYMQDDEIISTYDILGKQLFKLIEKWD
jgi:four helix bundle protein